MKGWKWTIVLDELGYWAGVVSVVPPPSVIAINKMGNIQNLRTGIYMYMGLVKICSLSQGVFFLVWHRL